ncbi:ubl carboxyl-terminal hydrolase 18-like [Thomomys bottae]
MAYPAGSRQAGPEGVGPSRKTGGSTGRREAGLEARGGTEAEASAARGRGRARAGRTRGEVEKLQALYTIQVKDSLVCLSCTGESSGTSCMPTLPLPLYGMDSKPLKRLVLKMMHLPQSLAIHLMRFCIRNSQTEKICHSLHFPQNLDLSHVLLTEQQDPVRPQSSLKGSRNSLL